MILEVSGIVELWQFEARPFILSLTGHTLLNPLLYENIKSIKHLFPVFLGVKYINVATALFPEVSYWIVFSDSKKWLMF